jgi:uronate dehydrogenase
MTLTPTVLVTGSAGRIGQAVVQELGEGVARGFDRVPTPGLRDHVVGDLLDPAAVRRAMTGIRTVVHLAATPDDVPHDPPSTLFPPNIVGVYNVLEAAREAGVKRLVLASSGQVVWYQRYRGPYPIDADVLLTPRSWYACTKVFLEAAGRSFHEAHGMSVIVVRLGWCPRDAVQVEQIRQETFAQDVYLSPNDAGRFFACAVHAPEDIRFLTVYATSKPVRTSPYDLEPTRRLLGFEPREQWPQGIEIVIGSGGSG